jgi:hypothetical protein
MTGERTITFDPHVHTDASYDAEGSRLTASVRHNFVDGTFDPNSSPATTAAGRVLSGPARLSRREPT